MTMWKTVLVKKPINETTFDPKTGEEKTKTTEREVRAQIPLCTRHQKAQCKGNHVEGIDPSGKQFAVTCEQELRNNYNLDSDGMQVLMDNEKAKVLV